MQDRVRQILFTPMFKDDSRVLSAYFINTILLAIISITSLFLLVLLGIGVDKSYFTILVFAILSGILLKTLLNWGYISTVAVLLVCLTWLTVTAGAVSNAGIYSPINTAYVITIFLAGVLFNRTIVLFVVSICILSGLGLIYGMQVGFITIPDNPISPMEITWIIYSIVYVVFGVLIHLASQIVSHSSLITQQISLELKQSTNNLKRAETLAHLGNFEFDIQTQSVKWSDEVYRIFGIEVGIPIAFQTYQTLLPEEAYSRVMPKVQTTIEMGVPYEIEHHIILPDGIRKELYAVGNPVVNADGQVVKIFGIVQGITERKRAEQVLNVLLNISKARHETDDLHTLLEYTFKQLGELISIPNFYVALYDEQTGLYSFPYGIDEYDEDWSPNKLTNSLTDYVRYTGKSRMVTEDDHRQLEISAGVRMIDNESKIWLGAPLKTQQRVIGVIAIQDYENDDVYQQSDLDLLTYVGENIASVIDSKRAESERFELQTQKQNNNFLQEFVGHMTHDLKTPLSVIKNSTYLLANIKEPSRQIEYIERINYQLDRLDKMIEDILTISHLDHIQHPSQSMINMNDLLKHVTQQLHPKMQRKNLKLDLDLSPILPTVLGSEGDLTRAMLNLLENATNYSKDNGEITIRTYAKDDVVVCEIRDSGIGIKSDDLSHIFDRFFRADNARDFERGTGLGLAIVSRVVELHNGSIDVNSKLSEGTTFTVRLVHNQMLHQSTL
jgi:PAS domain S-box-containing protein